MAVREVKGASELPDLGESEERFRLLTEAMPQIVCVLGPDGTVEYVNAAWVAFSGLDREATVRAGWEGVLHPDDLGAARECRRAALKRLSRNAPGRAPVYFAYSYLLRGGFRDGEDGLVFCTMRALYQQMVNIHKYDLRKAAARKGQ